MRFRLTLIWDRNDHPVLRCRGLNGDSPKIVLEKMKKIQLTIGDFSKNMALE